MKLTCIGRCLKEKTGLKKVVERLSRNLSGEDFSRRLSRRLVEGSASRVEGDTLSLTDGHSEALRGDHGALGSGSGREHREDRSGLFVHECSGDGSGWA